MDLSAVTNWGTVGSWILTAVAWLGRAYDKKKRKEQVVPDWLRSLLRSDVFMGLLILVGLCGSIGMLLRPKDCAHFENANPQSLQIVRGKFYKNEVIEIDGKMFDHCDFENVTFKYNGTALYGFNESVTHGRDFRVTTDNQIIGSSISLIRFLQKAYPNSTVTLQQDDGYGHPVP